jgi:chromosomal replication initiation ATPase DnaA
MGKISDAIDTVAKEYGIHRDMILGSKARKGTCRDFRASAARWKIIYNFCVEENMPYCHIAYYLNVDHTTVINAAKKMKEQGRDYMDQKLQNINNQTKYRHTIKDLKRKHRGKVSV